MWQALREGRVPPLGVGPHVLPKEAPGGRVTEARTPNTSRIDRSLCVCVYCHHCQHTKYQSVVVGNSARGPLMRENV